MSNIGQLYLSLWQIGTVAEIAIASGLTLHIAANDGPNVTAPKHTCMVAGYLTISQQQATFDMTGQNGNHWNHNASVMNKHFYIIMNGNSTFTS